MKKCVIIGSGLGGLSCGCILSKNGYEVTVLEQGDQIGGCLQCFHRGDVMFDTGMHYIGSAQPGQTLHTILQYLGIGSEVKLSWLDPKGYDIISYQGEHYHFANGKEAFVDSLASHFPNSRDELNRYYDLIKLVSSLQLKSESINTWKNGVERALKKYVTDGTEAKGQKCPNCGHESLIYQEGCLICKNCGASRCG